MKKKTERLLLVDVAPVKKDRRRGPPVYPEWKVRVRCLDCRYESAASIRAYDMHAAKKTAVDQLREADRAVEPPPKHRHRYACAAGPTPGGG